MKAFWLVFTWVLVANAQPPHSLWSRTFGGSGLEGCSAVQPTADGGYLLVGWTESFGSGDIDFWMVKTDADGDSLWSRDFGGSGREMCYAVQPTVDGGYVLAGETWTYGMGVPFYPNMWLVKTDANGYSEWIRSFDGYQYDACFAVEQTADSGYVLGGSSSSFGTGGGDMLLVKTRANGDSVWSRTFGGNGWDECFAVHQTDDGGYLLAGYTRSFGAGSADFWLVKTDANGDSLWSRTYGGSGNEECSAMQPTADGGYVLVGYTRSFGAGFYDMWMVKTDANGDSLWSRTFGGHEYEWCHAVQPTADGKYVLAGETTTFGSGSGDMWLVKTDANGDSLWSCTYGGRWFEVCNTVQQTADGDYVLAGYTDSFGAGNGDFWLVKAGQADGADDRAHPARRYSLNPIHPNPFNSTATISYDVPVTCLVTLKLFDLLGRQVVVLVDEVAFAGAHTLTYDASHLSSGVYLCRLEAGRFSAAQKMVLVK